MSCPPIPVRLCNSQTSNKHPEVGSPGSPLPLVPRPASRPGLGICEKGSQNIRSAGLGTTRLHIASDGDSPQRADHGFRGKYCGDAADGRTTRGAIRSLMPIFRGSCTEGFDPPFPGIREEPRCGDNLRHSTYVRRYRQ
mmetsp:Transcript_40795/g.46357  ORF Transcript_40795/g.46357 Transcript_40795/m.46357 type:complete len:139 (-) Transcript_40795:195-611(-)